MYSSLFCQEKESVSKGTDEYKINKFMKRIQEHLRRFLGETGGGSMGQVENDKCHREGLQGGEKKNKANELFQP